MKLLAVHNGTMRARGCFDGRDAVERRNMRGLMESLEAAMTAAAFAEEGEFETARTELKGFAEDPKQTAGYLANC
jgi:hypothetical protein